MALKLKTRTQFPANISVEAPLLVEKTGIAYEFSLDIDELRESLDPFYLIDNADSLILNGSTSGTTTVQASAIAGTTILTLPAATDTLVGKATTDELTNKTLTSSVAKGTWTASGTWTVPAFTMTGSPTLPNNTAIKIKDSGAVARDVIYLDASNNLILDTVNSTNIHLKTAGTLVLNVVPAIGAASAFGLYSSHPTLGIGYVAGAGGAVTQITSRTTGVTLNKISGAITMFSAAGSVGFPGSVFVVTNSAVAATDTVVVSVKSATNTYAASVVAVAAGSFTLAVVDMLGTATDAPVINFAVIKGVAA